MMLRVGQEGEVVTSLREDRGRRLEATVLGKRFSYSVASFFQSNFSILESLVQTVRFFLKPEGAGTLFDLYSGVGLFGVLLADSYERVIGIEDGFEAVELATENAKHNGADNVSFLKGRVETLLPDLSSRTREPLYVIIDPPRVGLKPEVIQCLLKLPIERLVYVSCGLEALARDLESFTECFQIISVQPMDLFPQTRHVETIVLLRPR